jgi:predicted HAD superfamily Cof-like phosphohydrolase
MSNEYDDVLAFFLKYRQIVSTKPTHITKRKLTERANFMFEELLEFAEASGLGFDKRLMRFKPSDDSDQDLAGQADALIDMVYVAMGTSIMLGLPWSKLWDEVHAANMKKKAAPTPRMPNGDAVKPPGWTSPDARVILEANGYEPKKYYDMFGNFSDDRCVDDNT